MLCCQTVSTMTKFCHLNQVLSFRKFMSKRFLLAVWILVTVFSMGTFSGCAYGPKARGDVSPIVFVHGDNESAGVWQDLIWRFESNGWPRQQLFALQQPYPRARDDDARAQAGRSSDADELEFLKVEIAKIIEKTGAQQVVLVGRGRGAFAARNYILSGGEENVSKAIFAGPDQPWIGMKNPLPLSDYESAVFKTAKSLVIARADQHDGTFTADQFADSFLFITGQRPASLTIWPQLEIVLNGLVTGMGLQSADPAGAKEDYFNNMPVPKARVEVFEVQRDTGLRLGPAVYQKVVDANGHWGPFRAQQGSLYEFVVHAPGYAVTHIYRSPFPRGSNNLNLKASRISDEDLPAFSIIALERLRGSLDPSFHQVEFDGQSPPPRKITLTRLQNRAISAEIHVDSVERVTGRTWPAKESHVVRLELTQ